MWDLCELSARRGWTAPELAPEQADRRFAPDPNRTGARARAGTGPDESPGWLQSRLAIAGGRAQSLCRKRAPENSGRASATYRPHAGGDTALTPSSNDSEPLSEG